MRFITFKHLQGKNFLSFGDELTNINLKPGVNAIIGTNLDKEDSKNGAGKSSIIELLYYSLFGATLREISKDHVQNSITKGRCETSLEFDVTTNGTTETYKVLRKLNPTKCQLFKNGEEITRSTLAKTNALVQQIIRTPATVFQNSVIMAVNNTTPFMALQKTDKRKFIESVLGLEVFTEMVLKARDDYSIAKKDYEIAYNKLEQTQTELNFNQTQFDNYEEAKLERLKKLHNKKAQIENDLTFLNNKISETIVPTTNFEKEIVEIKTKIEQLQIKFQTIEKEIVKTQAEINSESFQIEKLKTNKDICPTCTRSYSEEHIKHVAGLIEKHSLVILEKQKNISLLQEGKKTISKKIAETTSNLQQFEFNKKEADQKNIEVSNTKTSISFLSKSLKETEDEVEAVEKEQNNDLKGKLSILSQQTFDLKQKVDVLNNHLNVLETVKFVISEEGIKSFIVKKVLKVLNSRMAFYLKKLQANCLCQFNEFFDEEIIDEKTNQKSYFNFSGGERKRIDLACLFAFADIRRLQGDVNFSTVFYDELLDSSLDDKGVHLTLNVLRERFKENNESCYIITHRGPEVTTKAEHTIHATKHNGITTVSS